MKGMLQEGQSAAHRSRGWLRVLTFAVGIVLSAESSCLVTGGLFAATPLGLAVLAATLLPLWLEILAWRWWHSRAVEVIVLLCWSLALCMFGAVLAGPRYVLASFAIWGLLAVLGWRRIRSMKEREPALGLRGTLTAYAIGLVPGVALGLFFTVDEAPRQFPHLAVERPVPAEADNGFPLVEEMRTRLPFGEDPAFRRVWDPSPEDPAEGTPEWMREAGEVLAKWQPCLDGLDEALSRPRLSAFRAGASPASSQLAGHEWLSYARRLAWLERIQSQYLLGERRTPDAMAAADKAAQLGLRIQVDADDIITWLVGDACVAIGLEQVRAVATASAESKLLQTQVARLPHEDELPSGFRAALAGELLEYRVNIADIAHWSAGGPANTAGSHQSERAYRLIGVLLKEPTRPFLKVNMAANLVGTRLEDMARSLERFRPALVTLPAAHEGTGALARIVGWGRSLRDPLGVILAEMSAPAHARYYREYYRTLADLRLTQVFLAARCYQLERAHLPKTLDELAPKYILEVPADPFTEKPFVYEPDAAPPRLLSVGPDQRPDAAGAEEKDDIVLELAFPSP
jgi:hypothetical protein